MRARAFVRPRFAAALALLSACSLVNDPSDHQQIQPLQPDEFCAELAALACGAYLECCSTASQDQYDPCYSDWTSWCASNIGSLAADPRAGYDARAAAEVLAEGHAFADVCDVGVTPWVESRSGFLRVLSGSVAGGGDCTPNNLLDTAAYFSCDDLAQACFAVSWDRSVCADRRGVGQDCGLVFPFDCADGLWCNASKCAARLADGQPCPNNKACESLVCDDSSGTGICVQPTQDAVYCALDAPP